MTYLVIDTLGQVCFLVFKDIISCFETATFYLLMWIFWIVGLRLSIFPIQVVVILVQRLALYLLFDCGETKELGLYCDVLCTKA